MGKVKTRIERNKEIITDVYNYIQDIKEKERYIRFTLVKDWFLKVRLAESWSWVDLASLLNLIQIEIPREEFDEKCRDSAYGSWCFGDVVDFLANLIVDYPHIIEKLYNKEKEA